MLTEVFDSITLAMESTGLYKRRCSSLSTSVALLDALSSSWTTAAAKVRQRTASSSTERFSLIGVWHQAHCFRV